MHDRLTRALAKIEPFTGLDDESLAEVASTCRFERFEAKRQVIAYQDDSADVFFIVSGTVRVVIHSLSGKEISYRDLEGGEMFGELAAIDGDQRLYEMRTLDVQSRIRAELVRLAEDSLGEDNTATISPLPTSADIAARVNTRREAVSRELASLTRRGLIERHQKSLMIRDFAGLSQLVESILGE
jgi:CRP-like cAMP-binding protein